MTIHYMPSEIARLVLGYLRETNCEESAQQFIKESPHLTEYANGLRHGINYSTNIGGKSLMDLINSSECGLNVNKSDKNSNNNSIDEEIKTITKQLSSVDSCLKQLTQTMNTSINTNCNNYNLVSSPSIISSSSPLFVNTIGYNSTPIVLNEQNLLNVLNQSDHQLKTPSKGGNNSPRRKSLPRRRVLSGSSPLKSSQNLNLTIDSSEMNTSSERFRDESEPQLKIDINEPLVQPEVIVGELINFEPLHEALALNINKLFNNSHNSENSVKDVQPNDSQQIVSESEHKKCEQNVDPNEIAIADDMVQDIIANLELAPEYNTLLDIITEKELQNTPFKNGLSPFETTSSSASSLNTPQTPQMKASKETIDNTNVVKNLMPDLRTPEKMVTLYAGRNAIESSRIPSIKVTPVKVLRTNLTPCKTIFVSDFSLATNSSSNHTIIKDKNVPIILPNVSVLGENNQKSITVNQNNCYAMRVQTNNMQTKYYNSNGAPFRSKGKRVDFSKPASELQVKRTDLMPRKILPKPSNKCNSISTTITPVYIDSNETSVPKQQPIIKVNTNSNKSGRTRHKSNPQTNANERDRNPKRSSTATDQSPNKIRATETRFPTVNILRKMNVNKFLEQIHANPGSV